MRPIPISEILIIGICSIESWSHAFGGTESLGFGKRYVTGRIGRAGWKILVAPILLVWLGIEIFVGEMSEYFW